MRVEFLVVTVNQNQKPKLPMKKLTALLLFSFAAAASVRADVIWQDLFNYKNGPISVTSTNALPPTNAVWILHSGSADDYVNNHRLEVSSSSTYLGVTSTRSGDVNRQFSLTNGSPYTNGQQYIYVSFIVNFTNLPTANGAYFAHFKYGAPGSSSFEGRLFALAGNPAQPTNNFAALPNTYRLGVSAAAQSGSPNVIFPVDLALNADYQVVLFWDPVDNWNMTLWVNPSSPSDVKVASNDTFTPNPTNNIVNCFAFRQATGFGGFLTVSNLVVATTYDEAVTNVWVSNSVPPSIAIPLKAVTNYVEVPAQLSIVASGQGLADFNYRWQKDGADFYNPNGNSNVLPFSLPEVTDTGYYGVIVSNIFTGITATNPAVLMWVTNGPPVIAIQPTNQQVYPGKNVTISVVAQGSPTLNYSWLFNGAPPTNPNVDPNTINTPNLVVNNVQSGNGTLGKYNCYISNDYGNTNSFTNTLTLLTPQAVNIDTLRGMVDPVFFLPTNTSIYYTVSNAVVYTREVTNGDGTVNGGPFTGSANSEFFMQDSSGGIPVFVAGGTHIQPRQGDIVTVTGPLSQFNSLLQFSLSASDPSTSVTVTGHTNSLPAPVVLPFSFTNGSGAFVSVSNVIRHYEGLLVTLTNVYFPGNVVGSSFTSGNYVMTNASGGGFVLFLNAANVNIIGKPVPQFARTVTGPMGYYRNTTDTNRSAGFEIDPSAYSDIVAGPPVPVGASGGGGAGVINWTAQPFIPYSIWWQTNVGLPFTNQWIPIATGLTFSTANGTFTDNVNTNQPVGFYRISSP
jgi:hypothetical protein